MNKTLRIVDDGWFEATVQTADGKAPIRLDALRANAQFAALCEEHADEGTRAEAWVEWLVAQGAPRLTHGGAFRLAAAVIEFVAAFGARHLSSLAAPAGAVDSTNVADPKGA